MIGLFLQYIASFFLRYRKAQEGVAAIEAAMVFPILLTLMLGTFDLGNGILANQKTIRASQVTADLLARNGAVTDAMIADAIKAGQLAFEPLSAASYGVDIVSIRFDADAVASIEWRETQNMTAMSDVLERVADIAEANDGVLVVGVRYDFEPVFAGFVVDNIPMYEIAFARGRKGAVVEKE